jgi:hypothetical protein
MKKKSNYSKSRGTAYREQVPQFSLQTKVMGTGFPDSLRTSLQYTDSIVISAVSFQTMYVFRANSLYDPDLTAIGHQPAYFDTYASVYSKYKVLGAKISLTLTNNTSITTGLAIIPNSVSLSVGALPYEILDLPRSKWKAIGSANIQPAYLTHSASTAEILGLMNRQIDDDDYSSSVTSSPNQLWFWNLYLFSINTGILAPSLSIVVRITFDTLFYDRSAIPSS